MDATRWNWAEQQVYDLARKPWNPKLHPRGPGGKFFDGPDFEGDDERPARSGGGGVFGSPLGSGPDSSLDDEIAKYRAEVGYDRVDQLIGDSETDWTRQNGDSENRAGKFDTGFAREVKKEQDRYSDDFVQSNYLADAVTRHAAEVWPGAESEVAEAVSKDEYWDAVFDRLDGPEGRGIQDQPYLWAHILRSQLGKTIQSKRDR